ncbi:MAG: sialate O-acetylesterase [Phycisphaerales bacterium]
MFPRRTWSFLATILLTTCLASAVQAAELSLGGMFTDHAVIQRDKPIAVWGKAEPGAQVAVTLNVPDPQTHGVLAVGSGTHAGEDGKWTVTLFAQAANAAPCTLIVTCGDKTITIKDILIGDVWICSGQSNMQMAVYGVINAKEEIAAADYPNIRIFQVGRNPSLKPVAEVTGAWKQVSPQTIGGFSAVGYFFGRDLYKELNIPIGLVDNSWGGMPAEAYTSRVTLEADPDFKPILDRCERALANFDKDLAEYERQMAEIKAGTSTIPPKYMADPGNKGLDLRYARVDFDDTGWKTMKLPALWEDTGLKIDGAVWFRKVVTIPAELAGKELALLLGQIDDFDTAYFDGKQVGDTHGGVEESYLISRKYLIPAAAATAGSHVIAVRVFDHFGGGGIYAEPLQLKLADEKTSGGINLAGEWRYQVEVSRVQPANNAGGPRPPLGEKTPNNPAALWNGMTEPISPYAITGVIWYQGESNAGRAYQYRKLFTDMIQDWRKLWGDDTSFLFVQLANFMKAQTDPGEKSAWAELREAQDMALRLPRTALATAIDVGDADDIHPKDKQTVGHRLALGALAVTYGKPVVYQGPTYDSIKVEGDSIRIKFTHTDGGLKCKGDKLTGFVVAGEDQKWYWADATIDGHTVVVKSPDVAKPLAVRYGWANNPAMSLYNGKLLPAPPFRSDDWPCTTLNSK